HTMSTRSSSIPARAIPAFHRSLLNLRIRRASIGTDNYPEKRTLFSFRIPQKQINEEARATQAISRHAPRHSRLSPLDGGESNVTDGDIDGHCSRRCCF